MSKERSDVTAAEPGGTCTRHACNPCDVTQLCAAAGQVAEGECLHIVALLCYCAVHRLVSHFETFSHNDSWNRREERPKCEQNGKRKNERDKRNCEDSKRKSFGDSRKKKGRGGRKKSLPEGNRCISGCDPWGSGQGQDRVTLLTSHPVFLALCPQSQQDWERACGFHTHSMEGESFILVNCQS